MHLAGMHRRVGNQEQPAPGELRPEVYGNVLALIFLKLVPYSERGLRCPFADHVRGSVSRAIVDDKPFEITLGLRHKAVKHAV